MFPNFPVGGCTTYSAFRLALSFLGIRIARALASILSASLLWFPRKTPLSIAQKNQSGSANTNCGSVFPLCLPKARMDHANLHLLVKRLASARRAFGNSAIPNMFGRIKSKDSLRSGELSPNSQAVSRHPIRATHLSVPTHA